MARTVYEREIGIGGPLERIWRELVRVSQNGSFQSHKPQGKLLNFVSLVFIDGIFTQCFSPNYSLSFGLLVTVHQMDHLIKTSFSIYAS